MKNSYCLNCDAQLPEEVKQETNVFCPNCGQSTKDSKLSFRRLIGDALSNIFNLDSRLIHTFRDLIYPSKLSRTYIEGKRKFYVNPARLFVFTLLALITVSLYCLELDNSDLGVDSFYGSAERSEMMEKYNKLIERMDTVGHEEILDSINSTLFYRVRKIKDDTLGKNGPQFFSMSKSTESFGISRYDAIHLSQEELFEKYNITSFTDKLNVGQYIRLAKNPAGGIRHLIKNLTWAVFITVLLISFLMKLLYIRKNYYLVEHVVLVLNSHSLLFVFASIYVLFDHYIKLGSFENTFKNILVSLGYVAMFIVQYLSLKKYYRQGFFKTLIKQFLINTSYGIFFLFTVIMVAFISLLLY